MHILSIALATVGTLLIIIAAYLKFKKLFPSGVTGGVSAFAKIADAEVKQKEAEGKIIAVNALKTASEEALDAWLGENGIDISKVRTIEMPFSEMGAALNRGTVDAAILAEPSLTFTLRNGARILANPTRAVARQYLLSAWFSMRSYAEKNRDTVKRFASAIYDSARWANANRSESAVILASHAKPEVVVTQPMRRVQYARERSSFRSSAVRRSKAPPKKSIRSCRARLPRFSRAKSPASSARSA